MKSLYGGTCPICDGPWYAGDMIWFNMGRGGYYDSQHCAQIALGRVPKPVEAPNAVPAAYSGTPGAVSPSMGTTTTHSEPHEETTQERIERMHGENVDAMLSIADSIAKLREALCGVQLK